MMHLVCDLIYAEPVPVCRLCGKAGTWEEFMIQVEAAERIATELAEAGDFSLASALAHNVRTSPEPPDEDYEDEGEEEVKDAAEDEDDEYFPGECYGPNCGGVNVNRKKKD